MEIHAIHHQFSSEYGSDIDKVLRSKPNPYMTPFTFKKLMMTDLLINGNFYALIQRDKEANVVALSPLTAALTVPFIDKGKLYYSTLYQNENIVSMTFSNICRHFFQIFVFNFRLPFSDRRNTAA